MGIDIICEDKIFSCSNIYWYKIKTNIIKATIDYLQDKFRNDKELYTSKDTADEDYIGIGSYYDYYMNNMIKLINDINETNKPDFYYVNIDMQLDNTIRIFMRFASELKNISSLNYFELGGLYSLCNQSDNEGYYSPGNALDICLLLDKIKSYMKKYEGFNSIYKIHTITGNTLYEVFENSHNSLRNVSLC